MCGRRTYYEPRRREAIDIVAHAQLPVVVPTKEIDSVWHLHMLDPVSYYEDCMGCHGKIIGHNPALEGSQEEKGKLQSMFLMTSNLWKETYGEEYAGSAADCDGPDHACLECSMGDCSWGIEAQGIAL